MCELIRGTGCFVSVLCQQFCQVGKLCLLWGVPKYLHDGNPVKYVCFVCSWTHRCSWRAVFGITIDMLDKPYGEQYNKNTWSLVPLIGLRLRGTLHCKRTHEPVRLQTGSWLCCLRWEVQVMGCHALSMPKWDMCTHMAVGWDRVNFPFSQGSVGEIITEGNLCKSRAGNVIIREKGQAE